MNSQDGIYYAYGVDPTALGGGFVRYHSPDGLAWTLDARGILPATGRGWDAVLNGNSFVWVNGSTWYMLYEMYSGKVWQTGVATSSDGLIWSPYSNNPVITYPGGGCGGPEMHQVGETYYVWLQCAVSGTLPTQIYRFSSNDLHTWTRTDGNAGGAVLSRFTPDEGSTSSAGQVADPSMVEINGNTYMFYDACDTQDPEPGNAIHLKLAIAPLTFTQLVQTGEGDGKTWDVSASAAVPPQPLKQ